MNDAENLAKLLGHLKPELFRAFMAEEFGLVMPEPEKKQTKTEQREAMALEKDGLGQTSDPMSA
ncbi:MAG: hypothetical protein ACOY4L_10725 [Pseudomonadota bacterium]